MTNTCVPGMVVVSGTPLPGAPESMVAVKWRNAGCVGGCSVTCPTPSSSVATMPSAPPLPFCRKSQDLEGFISATLSGRPVMVAGEAGSLYRSSGRFAIKVRTEPVGSRVQVISLQGTSDSFFSEAASHLRRRSSGTLSPGVIAVAVLRLSCVSHFMPAQGASPGRCSAESSIRSARDVAEGSSRPGCRRRRRRPPGGSRRTRLFPPA